MIDLSEELARLNANIERVMEENTTLQMQNVRLKAEIVALIAENGALGRVDDEMVELASAISGNTLTISDSTARLICDLSNDADELSHEFSDERGGWYRNDSRVLANLYSKALRA